ncbi:hypothetical protein ACSLBF_04655 [Pseudoalteromonas sp. T1lg65]|uniref:hypothetical protein n=1 Tax=Pseudoalteromonas sp. T1lg65 TaxID=2077101 RepID=UPI003F78D6C8
MSKALASKFLGLVIVSGLLHGSSSLYLHLSPQHLWQLIYHTPTVYYQLQQNLTINPEELTKQQLKALLTLQESRFLQEQLTRLIKQKDFARAELYLSQTWQSASKPQQQTLLNLMIEHHAISLIEQVKVEFSAPVTKKALTLLNMSLGKSLDKSAATLAEPFLLLGRDSVSYPEGCHYTLSLYANNYDGVRALNRLREAYQRQPEPKSKAFCLSPPIYLAEQLACSTKQGFAYCQLPSGNSLPKSDFKLLMANEGNANVLHSTMTLSLNSNYDTFVHELMHFFGFEDEYPVPESKAKWLCASEGIKAPNLYVGHTPPNGWSPSRTCQFGQLPSFKPVSSFTLLEYQSAILPKSYRRMWLKLLHQDFQYVEGRVKSAE